MVLFKRKPVQFLPKPTIEDDNLEVCLVYGGPRAFFFFFFLGWVLTLV